ncbi:adenine deaminase C-terminal domain-containing protein [Nocardiopsis coralliicola]
MLNADLLIRGGRVVSVQTGEVWPADVAVTGEHIRSLLPPGAPVDAGRVIDAAGLIVAPGYVDAHMHVESSLLAPAEFARVSLARGTTTVLADAHEIVNVAGRAGQAWMIEQGARTRQTMRWAVPSCVPALDGFETAGARLDDSDIAAMLDWDGVDTLGEVMDYRAVVGGDQRMHAVIAAARRRGVRLDGHCPDLSGADLATYMYAGIDSDHCKNRPEVAVEKARLGMLLMLQEKCLTPEVVDALLDLPHLPDFCLVTDDIAVDALVRTGHLDRVASVALERGLPPLAVLRALTLHPARRLGLDDRGQVSPGRRADLVLLRSLSDPAPELVLAGGAVAGRGGSPVEEPGAAPVHPFGATVRIPAPGPEAAQWRVDLPDGEHAFRAIRVNGVDTSTRADTVVLPVRGGAVGWVGRTAVVAVFERHTGAGGPAAFAPVVGQELQPGAFATTYAHDSHNLTVVATSAGALVEAARGVVAAGGGMRLVRDGGPGAGLDLPIGGVMSERPAPEVAAAAGAVRDAIAAWGWTNRNAFMSLSTLTLAVSPEVKITDRGLVRVVERAWEPATVASG